ncbi:AMP-binding protein [Sphingopyxis sp. 113P3]|uniref:AMP-binding protein n=1 Tax=Sphingopyxis sp. (strain 113P3) TaxID=292913 RepID=UPI0006AD5D01|nr:AMP-binding protein [Sphingopyxis sp. 113P3]ALC14106.1 AMP-dependent synthetase [Sphingopyxis sp. 113P3]
MNIASLLARAGRVMADAPALGMGSGVLSDYRWLAGAAASLGAGLCRRFGLTPGDRVAILSENRHEYVLALFGCWWAGLVVVPVNFKLHAREIAFIVEDSGAALLITSPTLEVVGAQSIARLPEKRLLVIASADWNALCRFDSEAITHCAVADPAWIFYTSGTTGRPKGAILTHGNLLAMCGAYAADVDRVDPGDRLLHAAPMSHGSGLYILPSVMGFGCQQLTESSGFEPDEIFGLLKGDNPISFFAAPTMVGRLSRAPRAGSIDPKNLKTIIYGGGPMYLSDIEAALAVFGPRFTQIYGQGETPMTITVLPKRLHADIGHPRFRERLASVGYPQSAVQVVVADGDGRELPAGEAGEVMVRGATVMKGYWNNPEATARALQNGWLATGDIGSFDSDGFLTLRDRSKDVIISGGSNIYPREVEEVLLRHRAVVEASVIGDPHPDWGEEVVAFVVASEEISAAMLDRWCLDHIARFKRPKRYHFVAALPKNSYGKILKTQLRDLISGRTGDAEGVDRPS